MIDPSFFPPTYTFFDALGGTTIINTSINYNSRIQNYLSPSDFVSYKEAERLNEELWQSYFDQGLLTQEILYENVFIPELNDNIDVEIGYRTKLAPGVHPSAIVIHPAYAEWTKQLPLEIWTNNSA